MDPCISHPPPQKKRKQKESLLSCLIPETEPLVWSFFLKFLLKEPRLILEEISTRKRVLLAHQQWKTCQTLGWIYSFNFILVGGFPFPCSVLSPVSWRWCTWYMCEFNSLVSILRGGGIESLSPLCSASVPKLMSFLPGVSMLIFVWSSFFCDFLVYFGLTSIMCNPRLRMLLIVQLLGQRLCKR